MMSKILNMSVVLGVALVLVLSGCGGGGGGHSNVKSTTPTKTMPTDSDGDGVEDKADAFPNDASETTDSDGDGTGDKADAFPNDASRTAAILELPGQDPLTGRDIVTATEVKIKVATEVAPTEGSVTQSSEGNEAVEVKVTHHPSPYGPEFTVTNTVSNDEIWSVEDADKVTSSDPLDTFRGWKGVALKKDLTDGTLYVNAYTDIEAPTEKKTGPPRTVSPGDKGRFTPGKNFIVDSDASTPGALLIGSKNIVTLGVVKRTPGTLDGQQGTYTCASVCRFDTTGSVGDDREVHVTFGSVSGLIFTPSTITPDTDYLSIGYWLSVPNDATRADDYRVCVFADGNDPFKQSNLAGLTGTATYSGDAVGLHTSKTAENATPDIRDFTAAVSLTANFGDGSVLGTVSGAVNNFEVGGTSKSMTLDLGEAAITNAADGGFFTGDTSATGGFAGKWGGQFFGNGGSATDSPGSVAGTFGAAKGDGLESLIGAFGAHKQ